MLPMLKSVLKQRVNTRQHSILHPERIVGNPEAIVKFGIQPPGFAIRYRIHLSAADRSCRRDSKSAPWSQVLRK